MGPGLALPGIFAAIIALVTGVACSVWVFLLPQSETKFDQQEVEEDVCCLPFDAVLINDQTEARGERWQRLLAPSWLRFPSQSRSVGGSTCRMTLI